MIEALNVSKSYGSKQALDDVSLRVEDGTITGFVGPNGAGKSTLLRVIAGLTVPDRGEVTVDGGSFVGSADPAGTMGVFLSAEWLPPHITAKSYLEYICDLQAVPRRKADEILDVVGLGAVKKRRVKTFSLGMRQRLGVAAAIVGSPRNLILDEPVNGLDPDGIQWLRGLVTSVAREGGAVLISSHHMSELALVADHVAMLDGGHIVRAGPIESFVAEDTDRTYIEADDMEAVLQLLAGRGYASESHRNGLVIHGAAPHEIGCLLFREGPGVTQLRRFERSLEQTYFDEISISRSPERFD